MPLFAGIDLGTSGCRAVAIDDLGTSVAEHRVGLPPPVRAGRTSEQDPGLWWSAACDALRGVLRQVDAADIAALSVDGTSGTLLLADRQGKPLTPGLLYDDARADAEAARVAAVAPVDAPVCSPTASLPKLLHLAARLAPRRDFTALHQADLILGRLGGRFGTSDFNNALKLGYDAAAERWPGWIRRLPIDPGWLPEVMRPGEPLGTIAPEAATELGLRADAVIAAGTTDSTASVMAAGAAKPGDAVTVLGSTLAVKMVTANPVNDAATGVYSHRFGDYWLAGGASNTGGAVLATFFTVDELTALEPALRPEVPTGLDYYPLARPGERFPINDPSLRPRLSPRPRSRAVFLQGVLEGIAAIEAAGYRRLAELGCPLPERVITIGGGARNEAWRRIRERALRLPVMRAEHDEAAYGTALLARRGHYRALVGDAHGVT